MYMKNLVKRSLLMSAILVCVVFWFSGQEAHASSLGQIPLQVVDDIHNTPYPKMTKVEYYYYSHINKTEFTIDSPGEVRAIFREDMRTKSSGSAWICRDSYGNDIVGKVAYFSGAETGISWFLEKGTYYMFSTYGEMPTLDNVNQANYTSVSEALLFEKARSQETKTTTSFVNTNEIKLNDTYRGFLSNISPSDFYSFKLEKKANVTIGYLFDTSSSVSDDIGYCTLYDTNELYLTDSTYLMSDRGQKNLIYMLEPGTYYIRLNGILGNTVLNITPMYFDISLKADGDNEWTTEPRDIHLDTSIDYSKIVVLYRNVKDSLLNNDYFWSQENKAFVPIDGETFTAEDSGTYSVRITDIYGNNTMKKIKISNIDITEPEIEGVEDKAYYDKAIAITWSDEQSGIDKEKTKLNGKKVKSGVKVKKEGKYVLEVVDKVGNSVTTEFYIDFTAPTTNIENNKTYRDIVILQIKDNVSGVKKVVVDNMEQAAVNSSLYFYMNGEYVVEIWDNSDNYKKVEFKVKK